jgi:hypothetical protein
VEASDFLESYPEFRTAPTALISKVLEEVELFVSDSWGARRNLVVKLEVAARLAMSPQGRAARLSDAKTGVSTYSQRLDQLKRSHACGRSRVY